VVVILIGAAISHSVFLPFPCNWGEAGILPRIEDDRLARSDLPRIRSRHDRRRETAATSRRSGPARMPRGPAHPDPRQWDTFGEATVKVGSWATGARPTAVPTKRGVSPARAPRRFRRHPARGSELPGGMKTTLPARDEYYRPARARELRKRAARLERHGQHLPGWIILTWAPLSLVAGALRPSPWVVLIPSGLALIALVVGVPYCARKAEGWDR
jgi:hypothetical protein